jgi:hypothetical protein
MTQEQLSETGKKQLERGQQAREKSTEQYRERTKGKPTPTQEENDRAALGEHIPQKADDGSGPDPYEQERPDLHGTRATEAQPAGTYQTRQQQPQHQRQHRE